jgi:hypothetical protein
LQYWKDFMELLGIAAQVDWLHLTRAGAVLWPPVCHFGADMQSKYSYSGVES